MRISDWSSDVCSSDLPLYGKELTRLDLPAKVDGSANYAGDIRLPDMVFAAIRQGPLGATRLKGIDRKRGMASPGLLHVVTHDRWVATVRSEEHTSELQSLMRISYAVFCLKHTTTSDDDMSCKYTEENYK